MRSLPPSIQFLKNLSTSEINILTHLLRISLPPNPLPLPEQWHRHQANFISSLPTQLLRPHGILLRLATQLGITPQQSILCQTHKPLNPYLIRRIFLQIANESTKRVARLETHPLLPTRLSSFVKRMQSLNSLWMSPELYRTIFRVMPCEPRFERVESECEACILCFIGGHAGILSDLRSSMLGRRKKGRPVPRLLRFVEAWIEWTAGGSSQALLEESNLLAREIRQCRRQLQLARRQKRRNIMEDIHDERISEYKEEGIEKEGERDWRNTVLKRAADEEEAKAEHDFENSLTKGYEDHSSKPPALFKPKEGGIRFAYQDPLALDPEPGTFSHPDQRAQPAPRGMASVPHPTGPPPFRPQRPPPSESLGSVYHTAPQSQAPSLAPIAQPSRSQGPQRPQRPTPAVRGEYAENSCAAVQQFEPYAKQRAESHAEEYRALISK